MDEYGRETFDWPPLHTLRHKPLQRRTVDNNTGHFFLGANGHMPLQVFITDPKGEQRSEKRKIQRGISARTRKRGRVNGEQGIAKRHKGYRSPSVGESRGNGRSAVAEAKPKSPCRHCNGTGDSAVTDTYGSIGPVRQSGQKGGKVNSAVVPMKLVPSPPPYPPPSHTYPSGHKAGPKGGGKSDEEYYYDLWEDDREGEDDRGGEDDMWPTFQPEGHDQSSQGQYHGEDNHPNTERQDRQRRDPNDPGNPCEGGGDNPPWGQGG